MKKTIVYSDGTSKIEEDEPKCGDYCDTCGDCLHCYGEDECVGGGHYWVVYRDDNPSNTTLI